MNIIRFGFFILGMMAIVGCDSQSYPTVYHSISEILSKPLEWQGRTVRLKGRVTMLLAIPLIQNSYYEIEDASGRIIVETSRGLPSKGELVSVSGEVKNKVVIGDFSLGLVIVESLRI